ncbi:hypothetical protein N7492_006391 [Penicillium capsulatum]|uniref:Carrier domain-containing protein n=1 Tax=Penicillium capsulatum TaxID=69766 RepID=A0A9W9LKN7_9EURO|nr:hypothetical protein N7492_006391 [Penicillium capsulatum]KAJ6116230.1 hypothetical protein N7512_005955 [Penicillium capsulatum]
MHHALYDGVPLPFIFEDLVLSYQGASIPSRPQFSDAIKYLHQDQKIAANFWRLLPKIFLRRAPPLLAYAKVLSGILGQRDVVLGQVLARRSLPGDNGESTIGPLFNTIAQRITLDPKLMTNREMVQHLQVFSAEAQDHQHAPLGMVQNSLRQIAGLKVASLFDTLFVFQKSAHTSGGLLEEQNIWQPWQNDDFAAGGEHKLNLEIDHVDKSFDEAFCDIVEYPSRCAASFPEQLSVLPLRLTPRASDPTVANGSMSFPPEPIVRGILADIAGIPVENILPDISIFAIGLDSLSAIRIASVCRSVEFKAGVADILQGIMLHDICARIATTSRSDETFHGFLLEQNESVKEKTSTLLGVSLDMIEKIIPYLAGQTYHLASWLQSGRMLFEPAWAYSCSQRIDAGRLKRSWFRLRQRQPILRDYFVAMGPTEAFQAILSSTIEDDGTFQKEASHPSSLRTPPVRLRLLKCSDRDGIIVFINHAAYDAWSMPMAWNATLADSIPTLLEPSGSSNIRQLPATHQLFVGAWQKVQNLNQLEQICRHAGVGLQTVVLLASSRVLGQLTSISNPTFGLYQIGRSAAFAGIEKLSGPCLNVTPFTAQNVLSDDGQSIRDKIRSIQTAFVDRVPYEQNSLRDILAHCGGMPSPHACGEDAVAELFEPLAIGVPTEFMPSTPSADPDLTATSISALDTTFLSRRNLFVDIGPDVRTNSIGFGIRVEGGLMEETEADAMLIRVGEEIERLVSRLES